MKASSFIRPLVLLLLPLMTGHAAPVETDVLVYGGTPAGISAAVAAARHGKKVTLAEPMYFVGGMMAGGLTKTDIGNRDTIGGISGEFFARVLKHYQKAYGADSEQVKATHEGAFFEPKVAAEIFREMLAEAGVTVLLKHELASAAIGGKKLSSITLLDAASKEKSVFTAKVFIDASYEGDLLAATGVPYRVGREASAEFGESLAGMTEGPAEYLGKGDHRVQSFNMRSTLTNRPDILVPVPKPAEYTPEAHRAFVEAVKRGGYRTFEELFLDVPLWGGVNGKFDPNKADAVGLNYGYVEADAEGRRRIVQRLRDHWLSLWYMLQNDPELSEEFRASARQWGLPKDEFTESGNVSPQPYVRVGRRMLGRHFLTQNDVMDDRFKEDSICLGSYNIDSHEVQRVLTDKGWEKEGFIIQSIDPYEIPYRSITPVAPGNLLVSCAVSASHIAYGTLRMEPVFMMIGQAAGEAASLSINHGTTVQDIPVQELQKTLKTAGIALEAPFRPKIGITVKTPPPYQPGQKIDFEATVLRSRGDIKNLQWNFDGSGEVQAEGMKASYTYAFAKPAQVILTATDAEGFKAMPVTIDLAIGEGGRPDPEIGFPKATKVGMWGRAGTGLVSYRFRTGYHDMDSGKGQKSVTFQTKLPEDGTYRVAIAFPEGSNRPSAVPVTIQSADGSSRVTIDQRRKATDFAFLPLGEFRFTRGQPASVTISNEGTKGFVAADAVRWIRVPK